MAGAARRVSLEKAPLLCGGLMPIIYFVTQLIAAQFYPAYDFLHQAASELGAQGAPSRDLFNNGALATGVAAFLGGAGAFSGLLREGVSLFLALLVALCFASIGAGAINAWLFPLPSPDHNPGPIQLGIFILPLAAPLAFLFVKNAPVTKALLLLGLVAFAIVAAVMSGLTPVRAQEAGGLWQRVVAGVAYLPAMIVSLSLFARAGGARTQEDV
jgi:hypothetical protein